MNKNSNNELLIQLREQNEITEDKDNNNSQTTTNNNKSQGTTTSTNSISQEQELKKLTKELDNFHYKKILLR